MKFSVALKEIPVGGMVGRLERTGRFYSCDVCRTVTEWVLTAPDHPGCHCCSDECYDIKMDNEAIPTESIAV